jgi:hypothetical protein
MVTLCNPRTVLQRSIFMHRGGRQDHERLNQTFSRSLGASQTAYHRARKHANENLFYFFPIPIPCRTCLDFLASAC